MSSWQEQIDGEVRSLHGLTLEGLRAAWAERYGPPPPIRSADMLRRMLAWRVQAQAFGGLPPEVRKAVFAKGSHVDQLPAGVRLAREWKGQRHEVEITGEGVLYRGERFESFSHVARSITGVRWNGPRFFGLRAAK